MAFVAKRILMITNEMKFALNVKKALERNGEFTVAVFSSGKAGVDYARTHPQDVAVVDFRMKDMPGTDMVDHLRMLQHDIAIIVAPNHPAIHDLQDRYRINRIINLPMPIRKFVVTLNNAKKEILQAQTNDTPTPLEGFSVGRSTQTMEFWLEDNEEGDTVVDMRPPKEPDASPESSLTFQRLAAEEPPMPAMSEGSTIRDLRQRLTNLDEIKRVLATAAEEETEPVTVDIPDRTDAIPAARILEAALDESAPIRSFSIDEFMKRVSEGGTSGISPLPSWKREDDKYVSEPDFMPDELPFPQLDEAIEYTGTVTMQISPTIEGDPSEWTTDPIEPVRRSRPIGSEPAKATAPDEGEELSDTEAKEHTEALGRPKPPLPPELPDLVVSPVVGGKLPYVDFDDEDSEIAQLATTLTQAALESTAIATVLARGGEVIGYAASVPMSDLEGLIDQLTVEWDKAAGSDKSRILFAQIPETGAEFMVSTRATDGGFTLSLIFSGTRPLSDIRRQSKRLIDALDTVPEADVEVQEPQPVITDLKQITQEVEIVEVDRSPIAYLWLQRDPNAEFDNAAQTLIRKTLNTQLATSGWLVGDVQSADYVYVYGEKPDSLDARETLTDLMRQTAESLNMDAAQLWDDSYLIMQPGREMQTEDIQRFINFARR